MSSAVRNPSPVPPSAPFAPQEIAALNHVLGPASPTQRAWLSGFLAGLDAHGSGAPQAASKPQAAEPLLVLYATESGNCERLAADVAKAARKQGFKPSVVDLAEFDIATLSKAKNLIAIAATWGEGDPPARAVAGYNALMADTAPTMEGVKFGVLALGDTAYVQFCEIGKKLDERFAALGGKRAIGRVDCDLDYAAPAAAWIKDALQALAPEKTEAAPTNGAAATFDLSFGDDDTAVEAGPAEAEVTEHINLNSSRSDKQTLHLELAFDGNTPHYEPGDALDLYAENDPAAVDAILTATGVPADDDLRLDLTRRRDIHTLSVKTVETFVSTTGHHGAKSLLESGQVREWIAGRQLIDLFEAHPATLSPEQIRTVTRTLSPRAYSIASSRKEAGDEAHLLIARVRYNTHGRDRHGVASTHAIDRLRKGDRLQVKLRANRHFRLPSPETDIIMVGPGTGIAPFRAFVQERRATGATGRSWLFYGDRRFTHDFLYQLEWQEALKDGFLTRMDLAFSRDNPKKVYVQDRIWERRRDLIDWLDGGARFYVCGDAKAMAKDVRAALVQAYADVKALSPDAAEEAVRDLEIGRRYLQDVY